MKKRRKAEEAMAADANGWMDEMNCIPIHQKEIKRERETARKRLSLTRFFLWLRVSRRHTRTRLTLAFVCALYESYISNLNTQHARPRARGDL